MLYRVVISDNAIADLRAIHAYVEKTSSPDRAAGLLASLVRQIDDLERMPDAYPRAGQRVTSGDPVHTTHESSFRIYYGVAESPPAVTILIIRHGHRRQPRRFE